MDDGEIQDARRFLVLEEREVMKDVLVRARGLFCCHLVVSHALYSCRFASARGRNPPSGGSALASATQNTTKVAMYEPSIASGTTFIVFNTTTNSTITTTTLAVSPTKNARIARCGSVAAFLPKPTSAIARLAALLIPPPSNADIAACKSASAQLASAQIRVTAAWPSTTLRASRRGLGSSIAITAFPS